jgi:hypothetical protein
MAPLKWTTAEMVRTAGLAVENPPPLQPLMSLSLVNPFPVSA